jgi:serine/threonine protein kinase
MYTAVELFTGRHRTVIKPSKEADIYSFGIILYEMVTKNFKYRDLSVRDIHKKFKEENIRPKIPEEI